MRWRLRLRGIDYKVLECPGLVHQVPDIITRLIQLSNTKDCEQRDDDIRTIDSSAATSEQQLKDEGVLVSFHRLIVLRQLM